MTREIGRWVLCCSVLMVIGCTKLSYEIHPDQHGLDKPAHVPQAIGELAGPWEYEDKTGSHTFTLNAEGYGLYDWEDGRFETRSLENGIWTGVWIQEGNDREGGFELQFSDDASGAQGEWWYTRIGTDNDPLEPGGQFKMTRPSVVRTAQ